MFYTLLHITEGTIIPNCGWKLSKTQWKKYFKNTNVIVWSLELNIYWNESLKFANKQTKYHKDYIILNRKELSIVKVIEDGGLTTEQYKLHLKHAKEELDFFKRLK